MTALLQALQRQVLSHQALKLRSLWARRLAPRLALLTLTSFMSVAVAADITVSAAASLSDAFRDMAKRYEQRYPQDTIYLNIAGSGALLQQILNGAPVDVFAPADQWRMQQAQQADLILNTSQRDFAANALVVIVPIADQQHYEDVTALVNAQSITRIAIASPEQVPVGRYSQQALGALGLWQTALSKQIPTQNVRQTLDYVVRGEVDAGFVYLTDALMAGEQVRVVSPLAPQTPITYPIAVLKHSTQLQSAQRFVDFVLSDEGQQLLADYGFGAIDPAD